MQDKSTFITVPNSSDGIHCYQACLAMVHHRLGGPLHTPADLDGATGFRDGCATWPYQGFLWLVEQGYEVRHFERLDHELMARDFDAAWLDLVESPEDIEYLRSITDLDQLEAEIDAALASPDISFEIQAPSLQDIRDALDGGWSVIAGVHWGELNQIEQEEFEGHAVVVTRYWGDGTFELEDPGPPEHWAWRIPGDRLRLSMNHPNELSGELTLIRPRVGLR